MCTRCSWLSFIPSWHFNYEPRLDQQAGCKRSRLVWKKIHLIVLESWLHVNFLLSLTICASSKLLVFVFLGATWFRSVFLAVIKDPDKHRSTSLQQNHRQYRDIVVGGCFCQAINWTLPGAPDSPGLSWALNDFFWRIMIGPHIFCFMCRLASIPSFPLAGFLFAYLGLPPFFH